MSGMQLLRNPSCRRGRPLAMLPPRAATMPGRPKSSAIQRPGEPPRDPRGQVDLVALGQLLLEVGDRKLQLLWVAAAQRVQLLPRGRDETDELFVASLKEQRA